MPYLERKDGVIVGLYARPQVDIKGRPNAGFYGDVDEFLPDVDPEVVAFRAGSEPARSRDALAEIDALKAALVKKGTVSDAEIEAEKRP